jgi:DNA-binding transcriptional ArsR family regulator
MTEATTEELPLERELSRVFAALSDSTRRAIVRRLVEGEATMSELAAPFAMSLPGVSKHVSVLESAGLVTRWKSGRVRRCRIKPGALTMASDWITEQTTFWTETLDSFAQFMESEEPRS